MDSRPGKAFTWKELARLNCPHNAHVAYNGQVYNVSGFIQRHPGGFDQIMYGAGRDITQLFNSYHKPGTAKLLGEKCKHVGYLVENEMPTFAKESDEPDDYLFIETVRKRVARYFKSTGMDPKVNYPTFCRYALFYVLTLFFWYFSVTTKNSFWTHQLPLALSAGFCCALVGMTMGHDGNHFAITHSPLIWKVISFLTESLLGLSSYCWIHQHTIGHHVYTNIDGSDPDVLTSLDEPTFWRIKPFQKWFPKYRHQHVYMPILYTIFAIRLRILDFHTMYILKSGTIRMNPPSTYQLFIFFTSKLTHFVIMVALPLYLDLSLVRITFLNFAFNITLGWLGFITQINHINGDVEWVCSDPQNYKRRWYKTQVMTTQDYATDSWFWTTFTGALNHQVAHHLFPGVLQCYYPHITPIVKKTCTEFGIPYHDVRSTWDAFWGHVAYLKKLGQIGDIINHDETVVTSNAKDPNYFG